MRTNIKQRKRICLAGSALLLLTMVVIGCVYLDSVSVNQGTEENPKYYVNAGEVATFTVKGNINATGDESGCRLVVAYLVPKSWNARENTTMSYTATGLEDGITSYSMSLIPETSTLPKGGDGLTWSDGLMVKYGVATNVLNDMEWVAFWTDKVYDVKQHQQPTFTVTIKCKTGPKNLKAHLAFFIGDSNEGLDNGDYYKMTPSEECFQVVNGTGFEVDFCNYHSYQTEPLAALQDDYITFSFLADTYPNDLASADAIYLEATAITDDGKEYKVTEKTEKTLMKKEKNSFSNIFSVTMWPTEFFGIEDGETITRIEYIFTNSDGTISVTKSDDEGEEGDEPFVTELLCE